MQVAVSPREALIVNQFAFQTWHARLFQDILQLDDFSLHRAPLIVQSSELLRQLSYS